MSVDYSELSVAELNKAIADAQNALELKKDSEKEDLRQEVLELVASRGFAIEELFNIDGKAKKKGKLPPTHRDPNNPSNTWTGRGRKPRWLQEALDAGGKMEDFVL